MHVSNNSTLVLVNVMLYKITCMVRSHGDPYESCVGRKFDNDVRKLGDNRC